MWGRSVLSDQRLPGREGSVGGRGHRRTCPLWGPFSCCLCRVGPRDHSFPGLTTQRGGDWVETQRGLHTGRMGRVKTLWMSIPIPQTSVLTCIRETERRKGRGEGEKQREREWAKREEREGESIQSIQLSFHWRIEYLPEAVSSLKPLKRFTKSVGVCDLVYTYRPGQDSTVDSLFSVGPLFTVWPCRHERLLVLSRFISNSGKKTQSVHCPKSHKSLEFSQERHSSEKRMDREVDQSHKECQQGGWCGRALQPPQHLSAHPNHHVFKYLLSENSDIRYTKYDKCMLLYIIYQVKHLGNKLSLVRNKEEKKLCYKFPWQQARPPTERSEVNWIIVSFIQAHEKVSRSTLIFAPKSY